MVDSKPIGECISGGGFHLILVVGMDVLEVDAVEFVDGSLVCGKSPDLVNVFRVEFWVDLIRLGAIYICNIPIVCSFPNDFEWINRDVTFVYYIRP